MDKTNVKDYLLKVSRQKKKIQQKAERAEELLDKAMDPGAVRYDNPHIQTSIETDIKGRLISEAVDLQKEIIDDQVELACLIHERIDQILKLNDLLHIDILCDKYLYDRTLEEIRQNNLKPDGEEYTYTHIAHEHGKALISLAKMINQESEDLQK